MDLVIVTGLSGAGKSRAIDALEDIGYFCVDNMPHGFCFDLPRKKLYVPCIDSITCIDIINKTVISFAFRNSNVGESQFYFRKFMKIQFIYKN